MVLFDKQGKPTAVPADSPFIQVTPDPRDGTFHYTLAASVAEAWAIDATGFALGGAITTLRANAAAAKAEAFLAAQGSAPAAAVGSTTFKTSHYAPRLEAMGVNVVRAEAQVAEAVNTMRPNMITNAPISGRMTIDGVLVEYRVTLLPNGTANVGTIFPVK
ncbi:hypothetical protein LP085_29510 [Achromobacter sp. MY14]|uniref:hypothetical protein n=1 Tax=unclassified Achromobacter TaxID=2626865 RepID=UPI001E333295|nr:hypothetical protein [Achromobacter sp. MY14]MCD0501022.1 hypothetical protein [Achromobacter sp. MY14]